MADDRDRSDEDLARAAREGDAAAFDRLVRRFLRPSMALAWQYTRRIEDAEDVVQDAFHRAVRALPAYDPGRPFGAWFYTIVRNAARGAIAKDARRQALAPLQPLEHEPPAPCTAGPHGLDDIERAVESLSPMQQACFRLGDVEGFTSAEIALMLELAEGTVRTHLHRARSALRVALAPDPEA